MFSDSTRVLAAGICLDDLYEECKHATCNKIGDVKYVDSHCHLDLLHDNEKTNPLEITYPRQFAGAVTNFCFPNRWKKMSRYVAPWVWRSIGIHPKLAAEFTDEAKIRQDMEMIIRELEGSDNRIVAVGECGMDIRYKKADISHQSQLLRWQCEVAVFFKLPLIIHSGACSEESMNVVKSALPPNYPVHVHCFTYTPNEAHKWLSMSENLYLGLTGFSTQDAHAAGAGAVAADATIPLDRLLLETDSPMNKPVVRMDHATVKIPLCHPGHALNVACEIATRRQIDVTEVLQKTTNNFQKLYGIALK